MKRKEYRTWLAGALTHSEIAITHNLQQLKAGTKDEDPSVRAKRILTLFERRAAFKQAWLALEGTPWSSRTSDSE